MRRIPMSTVPFSRLLPIALGLLLPALSSCKEPKSPTVPPLTLAPRASASAGAPHVAKGEMHKKSDVVDVLHGVSVPDPYRWLEDGDSKDVKTFTTEQNEATQRMIQGIEGRQALEGRVRALLQVGFVGAPSVRTGAKGVRRYFHTKREGTQNQPVLYVREGVNGTDRVLIDAQTLSTDGTTALDWWYPSEDGALVAWGKSESGSEESTLHVRDVATGADLSDHIPHTRHASVAFTPDRKGFYYSRYPEPGSVPKGDEKYGRKIFFHKLGEDPKQDALVWGDAKDKTDTPSAMLSPDGRYLVVRVHQGWDKSEVYLKDLKKPDAAFVAVATGPRALFEPIPRNDRLYILTNDGAPRYELHAVSYDKPERKAWKKVIAEGADVLDHVLITDAGIVASFMHEASTRIERFSKDGKSLGPVALPQIGSAGISAPDQGDELFVGFTSYVVPYEVLRADLKSLGAKAAPSQAVSLKSWDRLNTSFSSADIEVSQIFATSKDGTRVPMFVIAKKGLAKTGKNPTVLYGYGGFNVNQTPAFSARVLATVEHGGVWVSAILRGGGEFGEAWHRAGMLESKQNVFDDFIACAETLISEKITSPDHLGIAGGSNGGLLVSAAITQRPELFRAGLSLVPLTDMLRYHLFRIGRLWVPEYGSAEDDKAFAWLYAYSPYHRVKDGVRYPSMLYTTAESDSRVDPLHARKMAARLQEAQGDKTRPILLRVETKAGHGAGKPVSKLTEELADELAFMFRELGIPLNK
jgi:prolyl oligopeptidase